jgi:formylglycine-generating enzyme
VKKYISGIFRKIRNKPLYLIIMGFLIAVCVIFSAAKLNKYTSTNTFCASCHTVHPHAIQSWKLSTHYDNKSGIVVNCVECHLPPEGIEKYSEKIKTGLRDVYGTVCKDVSKINWEEKSRPEYAVRHTFESSCIHCHQNLFPLKLSEKGEDAHLYYLNNKKDVRCINCHISVGHYSETAIHAHNIEFGVLPATPETVYIKPAVIQGFNDFTEYIPGTGVKFEMAAIEGGRFLMGSPENEPWRNTDEGPQREVEVSSFFIGKTEVSWDEYLAFFTHTASQGRMTEDEIMEIDGISGPTPPWGAPDQGWGKGSLPAITMTHYAASVYCQWLSEKTGKKYRLPTEAEWEYAARGGTEGSYFFPGTAADYSEEKLWNKIFKPDTSVINSYVIYNANSAGKTSEPSKVKPNPFGLLNTLGNVSEFCSDWYSPDTYSSYSPGIIINPTGHETGVEHVIRGGAFNSNVKDIRCAARNYTRTQEWLKTDPQIPKSKWWYSDAIHVGFRVVCEFER